MGNEKSETTSQRRYHLNFKMSKNIMTAEVGVNSGLGAELASSKA